jgi:predicted metalloprotease with PDZ domain
LRLAALTTGSPAERGGLQQGDVLVSIGGTNVSRDNWASVLNRYKKGDHIPVTVRRFRRNVELSIELGDPDVYDYRIEELPNASAETKRLRAAWLEGK